MLKLTGRYKLTAGKADGSRRSLGEFKNIILDAGLNRIGQGSSFFGVCQVGTGITEPSRTDTALTAYHRHTSTTVTSETTNITNNDPYTATFSKTFRFPVGTITQDITEIGVGWGTTDGLFSKSLIKDLLGAPTSVTVFADEFLDVSYAVDIVPPDDIPFTAMINGLPRTGFIRAAKVNDAMRWSAGASSQQFGDTGTRAYTGPCGVRTAQPSGTSVTATSLTRGTYVAGQYYFDYTARWDYTRANWPEGIKSILFDTTGSQLMFCFQLEFDTAIIKNDTESFRMTLRVQFSGA